MSVTDRVKQLLMVVAQIPLFIISLPFLILFYVYIRVLEVLFSLTRWRNPNFFPTEMFPWTSTLENNWRKIRTELDALVADLDQVPNYQDLAPSLITDDDKWKAVVLSVAGHRIEENARLCPETAKLLDGIPGLMYAMFSVLKPGKHLRAHRSLYGGVLNCHFPLRIPKDRKACVLRVGGESRHYDEGRMLVFNDRHVHEAWNRSDELRVVLLMYVERPLPYPLSSLNRLTIWLSRYLRANTVDQIRKVANEAGKKLRQPGAVGQETL